MVVDTISTSDDVHSKSEKKYMFAGEHEIERLTAQHDTIKMAMGQLVLPPIDFTKPGLKILDSGTADGESSSES